MGAMLEISYQLTPFVRYHLGSQNCEMKDGWDYKALLEKVRSAPMEPVQVVRAVVDVFEDYYKPRALEGIYTHAAIDLSHTGAIKGLLDTIAQELSEAMYAHGDSFKELLIQARMRSPRFCLVPMYTDIAAFCKEVLLGLEGYEHSEKLAELKQNLSQI